MICENCGKNEVEVLIKQVSNQEVRTISLCKQCAEELGFIPQPVSSVTISFSLADGFQRQRKPRKALAKKKEQVLDASVCQSCGTRFSEFLEERLLGCPQCYEEFRPQLGAYLQKTQGVESHWIASDIFNDIGVAGFGCGTESGHDSVRLRAELSEAIADEDYERAAKLRDLLAPPAGESGDQDA